MMDDCVGMRSVGGEKEREKGTFQSEDQNRNYDNAIRMIHGA